MINKDLTLKALEEGDANKQFEILSGIKVKGESITTLPHDLYIPPDALEVFLEQFEGPLDLLLYFIKKQNINILDIPVAEITSQYIKYIEVMKEMRWELAAEYLVMAAMLAEIKSRMLLPKQITEDGEEEDPRAELIRRLQEYERYKKVAEELDELPRKGRDIFTALADASNLTKTQKPLPKVDVDTLFLAFKQVLQQAKLRDHHHIQRESLSVRERMSQILAKLESGKFVLFTTFFNNEEGRMGFIVNFIAILELLKESIIEVVQTELFAPIYIKKAVE